MLLIKIFLFLIILLLINLIKDQDDFIDLKIKEYNKNIKKIINSEKVKKKFNEFNYNNLYFQTLSPFNKIGIFNNNFMNGAYLYL